MTAPAVVAVVSAWVASLLAAGPAGAGLNVWTGTGPAGGPIRAVLVDPAAPSTVYVGTNGSGVFKSTDGGITWAQAGAELAGKSVRALVKPSTTIYAAVEDLPGASSGGVYQSTDGGATWTAMDSGLTNKKVQALVWDGTSLFAGTREESGVTGGVFRWDGLTWTQKNTGLANNQSARRVQALAVDTRPSPPVIYAGTQGEGVFKSVDSGENWQRIDNPANQGFRSDCLEKPEILSLAVDETVPLVGATGAMLYAGATGEVGDLTSQACTPPAQGGGQGQGAGFFRYVAGFNCDDTPSTFGCWDRRMGGPTDTFATLVPTTLSTQVWSIVLKNEATFARIYIGTDLGVFTSDDSAGSWDGVPRIDLPDGLKGMPIRALGIDQTAACAGGTVRLHAGSGGRGMFHRCPNATGVGEHEWEDDNSGLTALRSQALAVGQRGGIKAVFAGLVGGGVITSIDNGASWQDTEEDSLTVRGLTVDPTNPNIVYAATGKGVLKTVDGGDLWTANSAGLPTVGTTEDPFDSPRTVRSIVVDPTDPNVVYAAVSGVYRSVDGGATWIAINGNLPTGVTCGASCPGNGTISALAIDHSPGSHATWGTLYAASDGATGSGVYRSTDGGATWTLTGSGLPVISLALDRLGQSGPTLYAGTSTGLVYRSVNGGAWSLFGFDLPGQPITALAVRLSAPVSRIYAGTDGSGVYSIAANGQTWAAMNNGLGSLNVAAFIHDAEGTGSFWAATLGRGIFDFQIQVTDPPLISITSPPPPSHTAAGTPVALSGSAGGGSGGVFQVFWSTNRGHAGFASGINPWNASVILEPGDNVVTVTAVDFAGTHASALITVDLPSSPPNTPGSLGQFKSNGTTSIPVGGATEETTVVLKGTVTDGGGDTVKLQVEVRPLGTGFTGAPTHESALVSSGGVAAATVSGLTASTSYHWQARAMNSQGGTSGWVAFGGNAETTADFIVGSSASTCPAEVIIDNLPPGQTSSQIAFTGTWKTAVNGSAFGANASLVSDGSGLDTYTWKSAVFSATDACTYEVHLWWTSGPGRTTQAPYKVINAVGGTVNKKFDQTANGGQWNLHGTYTFPAGVKAKVKVTDKNGKTSADAVRFVLMP